MKDLKLALGLIKQDRGIWLLALAPISIGSVLFALLFNWLFFDLKQRAMDLAPNFGGNALEWLLIAALGLIYYFAVSFFFIFAVSLLSAPFNDLISARVERKLTGRPSDSSGKLIRTLINEGKKLLFLGAIGAVAFLMSLVPFLLPVSFVLSAFLVSANFLDYSWSRHHFKVSQCLADIRNSFLSYGLSGGGFLLALSVPLLNIPLLPFATVYYTVLFLKDSTLKAQEV